jgi:hypothetical protein
MASRSWRDTSDERPSGRVGAQANDTYSVL